MLVARQTKQNKTHKQKQNKQTNKHTNTQTNKTNTHAGTGNVQVANNHQYQPMDAEGYIADDYEDVDFVSEIYVFLCGHG